MEKLEISIPYSAENKKVSKVSCAAWIVAGLALIGLLIGIYYTSHLGQFTLIGLLILTWLVYLIYVFFAYTAFQMILAKKPLSQILITSSGIGLPQQRLGVRWSTWHAWPTIRALQIDQHADGDVITFALRNDKVAEMSTNNLTKPDLEQLLLGIELLGKQVLWQPEVIEYRDRLQNENRGITGVSYTQLWQNELSRHFSPTTFGPLAPGKSLRSGTLTIKRQLAFGGFSAVYLAEDSSLGEVVIKELVPPVDNIDTARQKAVELFEREALLLSKLKHPRIVSVLDHFLEDGRRYIVLERIEGDNLRQLVLQKGPMPESQVVVLAVQMAQVLCYLHSLNPPLIHKDFTPDNLVLRIDGQLMVVDFGSANEFLGSATGTLVGKQFYMPPEQLKGKPEASSDIFAMGCTLFFLLTGQDPKALTTSIPHNIVDDVSVDLDKLVTSMTSLDPGERKIDAGGVLSELQRIGENLSGSMCAELSNLSLE